MLGILPNFLSNLFPDVDWLYDVQSHLIPGSKTYLVLTLVIVAVLGPLGSFLFYWRRRAAFRENAARRRFRRAWAWSTGFLLALVVAQHCLFDWVGIATLVWPGALTVLVVTTIATDLWVEVRARWRAPDGRDLEILASHQDVADAVEAAAELPSGRSAVIQGLRYRSLLYFFGPFVPLQVLGVPDPEATDGASGPETAPPESRHTD